MRILIVLVLLISFPSLSWSFFDSTAHLTVKDTSTKFRWVQARFTLAESLQTQQFKQNHWISSTWARLETWGQIAESFSFRTKATAFTDISNLNYPFHDYQSYNGLPYNGQGNGHRTWDYITATSKWQANAYNSFSIGLDYLQFGPSFRNSITFSGEQNPWRPWMDTATAIVRQAPVLFAGFDMVLSWIKYEQYSGQLQHDRTKGKYFHTHRLDFTLPFKTTLSLHETVVYGTSIYVEGSPYNDSMERNMALLYAMPFVPYIFAGHYYGDRDNGALGIDLVVKPTKALEFYSEFLLDDSKSPLSMFDDSWWGNKWAFSGGFKYASLVPIALKTPISMEWRGEYTQIMPWVYTHFLGPSHQYTHFGKSLGSNLGPNSREIFSQLQLTQGPWGLTLHTSYVSKDTAFGSNLDDIHTMFDPTNRVVLSPKSTLNYSELGAKVQFKPRLPFFVSLGAIGFWGDYNGLRTESHLGFYW